MSALIDHEHSDSPTIVDTNMNPVGNSNVTKSAERLMVKPPQPLVPANTDNMYRYACNKKAGNSFLNLSLRE